MVIDPFHIQAPPMTHSANSHGRAQFISRAAAGAAWVFSTLFALAVATSAEPPTPAKPPAKNTSPNAPAVVADPRATANWLAALFTVQEGKIHVAGKPPGDFYQARLPFPKSTEIKFYSRGIVANQEGLYPLLLYPDAQGFQVSIYTPFRPVMDFVEQDKEEGLPGWLPHPKAGAMTDAGFRTIGEMLHAHFTKITGHLPERYRTKDTIGFPSESYIWEVGKKSVVLRAYHANDNHGLILQITDSLPLAKDFQTGEPTAEKIFDQWVDPLPSRPAPAAK
jgi:hypothetical protein